jgi:hypothetical protein
VRARGGGWVRGAGGGRGEVGGCTIGSPDEPSRCNKELGGGGGGRKGSGGRRDPAALT